MAVGGTGRADQPCFIFLSCFLVCYLSGEAVLMHVYILEYSKCLGPLETLQFEYLFFLS